MADLNLMRLQMLNNPVGLSQLYNLALKYNSTFPQYQFSDPSTWSFPITHLPVIQRSEPFPIKRRSGDKNRRSSDVISAHKVKCDYISSDTGLLFGDLSAEYTPNMPKLGLESAKRKENHIEDKIKNRKFTIDSLLNDPVDNSASVDVACGTTNQSEAICEKSEGQGESQGRVESNQGQIDAYQGQVESSRSGIEASQLGLELAPGGQESADKTKELNHELSNHFQMIYNEQVVKDSLQFYKLFTADKKSSSGGALEQNRIGSRFEVFNSWKQNSHHHHRHHHQHHHPDHHQQNEGRNKRVRTIFTTEQLQRLEEEFERQQYMVGTERYYLASSLQLTEAQVKVWFQNRRIKWRKQCLEHQHSRLSATSQSMFTSNIDDVDDNLSENSDVSIIRDDDSVVNEEHSRNSLEFHVDSYGGSENERILPFTTGVSSDTQPESCRIDIVHPYAIFAENFS